MKELKDNLCEIDFHCPRSNQDDCVYFKKSEESDKCKYLNCGFCFSAVARVNRLTLELNSLMKVRDDVSASKYVKSIGYKSLEEFSDWCGVHVNTLKYKWKHNREEFLQIVEEVK